MAGSSVGSKGAASVASVGGAVGADSASPRKTPPAKGGDTGDSRDDESDVASVTSPLSKLIALSNRDELSTSPQQAPPPTIGQQLNAINLRINARKRLNEAAAAAARKERTRALEELQRRGAAPRSSPAADASGSTKRPSGQADGSTALKGSKGAPTRKALQLTKSNSGGRKSCAEASADGSTRIGTAADTRGARSPPGEFGADTFLGGEGGAPLEDELLSMFGWGDEDSDPLGLLYLEPGAIADSNAVAVHGMGRSPMRGDGGSGGDGAGSSSLDMGSLDVSSVLCGEASDFLNDSVDLLTCNE